MLLPRDPGDYYGVTIIVMRIIYFKIQNENEGSMERTDKKMFE